MENSSDPMTEAVGNNNMTSGWQTACKPGRPRLLNSSRSTKICTWNVQTMYQAGKAENIIREMTKYNIDVLGVTESRWTGSGDFKHLSGMRILYSGHQDEALGHHQGVALMLTTNASKALISWLPHGPRIMEAYFKTSNKKINLRLILVYAPTEDKDVEVKNNFYDQLDKVYREGHKEKDVTMLLGDLNAKVGDNNENMEEVMGSHGLGSMNDNGDRLVSFCTEHKLVIGGTLFPHKKIHTATWKSPDHITLNQIDHICISKKFRRSLLDVKVQRGADVNSDHFLLSSSVKLKLKQQQATRNPRIKYDISALQDQDRLNTFNLNLQNRFEALTPSEDDTVEDSWDEIKTVFNEVSKETLGFKKNEQQPWISQNTINLMNERQIMRNRVLDKENEADKASYNRLSKAIKKSAQRDKRSYTEDLATRAENAARQNRMKEVYDITRKLTGKFNKSSSHIRDKQGNLLKTDEDTLNRWSEHFNDVLNVPSPDIEADIPPAEDTLDILTEPPSLEEIKIALKTLKNNKAAGPDNIPAEVLKADIDLSAKSFLPLIHKIWNNEICPEDWINGHITILPKKGDLTQCGNYRGIMLLSVPGRILSRIILSRIKSKVDEKLRPNQAGFRPNRSTTDQITTLRIIIEQSKEWNSQLFVNFIDYKKAFDSLDRTSLWKILRHYGIPQKIVNIIKSMYEGGGGKVMFKGKLSDLFKIKTGVRQGCLLSPFLFLLAIDWIMRKCEARDGIQWSLTDHLNDLDYADDIALLSTTRQQMQRKTDKIAENSKKIGLNINIPKTKILRINATSQEHVMVGDVNLEDVNTFEYLGSKIDESGGTDTDVKARICKARSAFASLNKIWNSRTLSVRTKLRLFNSNVMSVLLYGAETWFLNKTHETKLQVFINKCLRRIHKVFWPNTISNKDLLERSNMNEIKMVIKQRKWRWLGHTLRKGPEDITKQSLRWNPQGKRKAGRPRNTWRRELEKETKEMDKDWSQLATLAADKKKWRDLVRSLCPS